MNSAVIFVKSQNGTDFLNNAVLSEELLCHTVAELKKADVNDVYTIGLECEFEGVKPVARINDLLTNIDPQGKCLLTSPIYPNITAEEYKKLLEVEEGGAVIADGEDMLEVYMVPSDSIMNFENIDYVPVKVQEDKRYRLSRYDKVRRIEGTETYVGTHEEPIVMSLTTSKELVDEICSYIGIKPGSATISHFADGETLVELGQSVRGRTVYVVQSTSKPVNESLMELLICVDALHRSSAGQIICIMPYFGYARQDRKAKPRQPITAKLVASLIEAAGANRVIAFDLHAPQIQGFFSFPVDDLTTVPMMADYFLNTDLNTENLVVVSPDHGGVGRARRMAEILNCPIAIVDKRRPRPNEVEAQSVIGDVDGKNCLIVDDICDTGGSLCAAATILKNFGAKDVTVCIAHGVLSHNALDRIEKSDINKFVISNTIPVNKEEAAKSSKLVVLSVGWMLANMIHAITKHLPISGIYDLFNQNED